MGRQTVFGHSPETSPQKHPSNAVVLSQRFSAMIYLTTFSVQQVWILKFKICVSAQ